MINPQEVLDFLKQKRQEKKPFTITNSSKSTFLDCSYKYFLEYIVRLSPQIEADYFTWGSLFHEATELLERDLTIDQVLEAIRTRFEEEEFLTAPSKFIERVNDMLTVLPDCLGGYLLKYQKHDTERYEQVGVETKFHMPLPCGASFEGKIDKIVREKKTGLYKLWERKTPRQTGDSYYEQKRLDSQPKGYLLATQKAIGYDVTSVIYDIAKKPQLRQKKNQTPEQYLEELGQAYLLKRELYFERVPIDFEQSDIDGYLWELNRTAIKMATAFLNGSYEKHHPGNRFGHCMFEAICLNGGIENNAGLLRRKFITRPLKSFHPEL